VAESRPTRVQHSIMNKRSNCLHVRSPWQRARHTSGKCHSVDKAKKGPAFKKVAAGMKGTADAAAKLTTFLTTGPIVKTDDGTQEEHKALKDTAVVKNLVQFILAQ
jgi:cytochrome c551/c552